MNDRRLRSSTVAAGVALTFAGAVTGASGVLLVAAANGSSVRQVLFDLGVVDGVAVPRADGAYDSVKVVNVTTSDGSDAALRTGAVAESFRVVQSTLSAQTGGIRLNAENEIANVRLRYTRAEMELDKAATLDVIEAALQSAGLVEEGRSFVVYYDGPVPATDHDSSVCGVARGELAVTFTDCAPVLNRGRLDGEPASAENVTIHEVLHILGAGHVESPHDVMNPVVARTHEVIDPGRDDYWPVASTEIDDVTGDRRLIGPAMVEAAFTERAMRSRMGAHRTGTLRIPEGYARLYEQGWLVADVKGDEVSVRRMDQDRVRQRMRPKYPTLESLAAFRHAVTTMVETGAVPRNSVGWAMGEPEMYGEGLRWRWATATAYAGPHTGIVVLPDEVADRYEALGGPMALGWPLRPDRPERFGVTKFENAVLVRHSVRIPDEDKWSVMPVDRTPTCLSTSEHKHYERTPELYIADPCR